MVDMLVAERFQGRGTPPPPARMASSCCCCCCGEDSWLTVPAEPADPDWKDTDMPESETGREHRVKQHDCYALIRAHCSHTS